MADRKFNRNMLKRNDIIDGLTDMSRNKKKLHMIREICKHTNDQTKKDFKEHKIAWTQNNIIMREEKFTQKII